MRDLQAVKFIRDRNTQRKEKEVYVQALSNGVVLKEEEVAYWRGVPSGDKKRIGSGDVISGNNGSFYMVRDGMVRKYEEKNRKIAVVEDAGVGGLEIGADEKVEIRSGKVFRNRGGQVSVWSVSAQKEIFREDVERCEISNTHMAIERSGEISVYGLGEEEVVKEWSTKKAEGVWMLLEDAVVKISKKDMMVVLNQYTEKTLKNSMDIEEEGEYRGVALKKIGPVERLIVISHTGSIDFQYVTCSSEGDIEAYRPEEDHDGMQIPVGEKLERMWAVECTILGDVNQSDVEIIQGPTVVLETDKSLVYYYVSLETSEIEKYRGTRRRNLEEEEMEVDVDAEESGGDKLGRAEELDEMVEKSKIADGDKNKVGGNAEVQDNDVKDRDVKGSDVVQDNDVVQDKDIQDNDVKDSDMQDKDIQDKDVRDKHKEIEKHRAGDDSTSTLERPLQSIRISDLISREEPVQPQARAKEEKKIAQMPNERAREELPKTEKKADRKIEDVEVSREKFAGFTTLGKKISQIDQDAEKEKERSRADAMVQEVPEALRESLNSLRLEVQEAEQILKACKEISKSVWVPEDAPRLPSKGLLENVEELAVLMKSKETRLKEAIDEKMHNSQEKRSVLVQIVSEKLEEIEELMEQDSSELEEEIDYLNTRVTKIIGASNFIGDVKIEYVDQSSISFYKNALKIPQDSAESTTNIPMKSLTENDELMDAINECLKRLELSKTDPKSSVFNEIFKEKESQEFFQLISQRPPQAQSGREAAGATSQDQRPSVPVPTSFSQRPLEMAPADRTDKNKLYSSTAENPKTNGYNAKDNAGSSLQNSLTKNISSFSSVFEKSRESNGIFSSAMAGGRIAQQSPFAKKDPDVQPDAPKSIFSSVLSSGVPAPLFSVPSAAPAPLHPAQNQGPFSDQQYLHGAPNQNAQNAANQLEKEQNMSLIFPQPQNTLSILNPNSMLAQGNTSLNLSSQKKSTSGFATLFSKNKPNTEPGWK